MIIQDSLMHLVTSTGADTTMADIIETDTISIEVAVCTTDATTTADTDIITPDTEVSICGTNIDIIMMSDIVTADPMYTRENMTTEEMTSERGVTTDIDIKDQKIPGKKDVFKQ
jgi:hypothetical protein